MNARRRYSPPKVIRETTLTEALAYVGRPPLEQRQMSMLASDQSKSDSFIFYAGQLDILRRPAVAIVGARDVSELGKKRARRLARELADRGVVVVSGLAKGVDVNAHQAAMDAGGFTVAVIGTPLQQAYPAEHASLQELIADDHLLISPFADGTRVFQSNFPKRNRVMAALTDGTVIVQASDTSGTLHQAAECQRLGRWLFILKSVFDDPSLKWPRSFASYEKTVIVESTEDVLARLIV
ncbi:DNA-processing protein DprA [Caulobacter vibrioides]|nr:DNA-processing protein DprA [Caulobacter vibrioides]